MNGLTLKDFLPLIGTIITVIAGYTLISVQVNKNRRAKWIDDFRKEVANFMVITISINKAFSVEKAYDLLRVISVLILFLFDSKQPPRRELVSKLREIQTMIIDQKNAEQSQEYIETFAGKLANIMSLASHVILIEQKKI